MLDDSKYQHDYLVCLLRFAKVTLTFLTSFLLFIFKMFLLHARETQIPFDLLNTRYHYFYNKLFTISIIHNSFIALSFESFTRQRIDFLLLYDITHRLLTAGIDYRITGF